MEPLDLVPNILKVGSMIKKVDDVIDEEMLKVMNGESTSFPIITKRLKEESKRNISGQELKDLCQSRLYILFFKKEAIKQIGG